MYHYHYDLHYDYYIIYVIIVSMLSMVTITISITSLGSCGPSRRTGSTPWRRGRSPSPRRIGEGRTCQHYWVTCSLTEGLSAKFHLLWQRDFLGTPVKICPPNKCQGEPSVLHPAKFLAFAAAPFTPSPPMKSLDFRGFDSSRLLILRGGNSHVRWIL